MFIGSEGVFGVITEAVVKIEPIPQAKHYEGWPFPTLRQGTVRSISAPRTGSTLALCGCTTRTTQR